MPYIITKISIPICFNVWQMGNIGSLWIITKIIVNGCGIFIQIMIIEYFTVRKPPIHERKPQIHVRKPLVKNARFTE